MTGPAGAEGLVAGEESPRPGGQQRGPVDWAPGGQADEVAAVGHLRGEVGRGLTDVDAHAEQHRGPAGRRQMGLGQQPGRLAPVSSRSLGHLSAAGAAAGATASTAPARATPAAATVSQTASR